MSKAEEDVLQTRRQKLYELRQNGNPFPNQFTPTHKIGEITSGYQKTSADELQQVNLDRQNLGLNPIRLAGRILLHRVMGKASFAQIGDHSGIIQIYLKRQNPQKDDVINTETYDNDVVNAETYDAFKKWDLGDIVGVEGWLYRTQRGELTLKLIDIQLLTKNLRPLPDKFHGLADQDLRYRQRYLDLISNAETVKVFETRSRFINNIRKLMTDSEYLEVETPMMHSIPGGTTAKPFITHHNSLGMDLYLRIAPELYLKRLIVGGFTKIFELNRSFRNEGLSPRHNPEFTMMEYYCAYSTHLRLMDFTENLIREAIQQTLPNQDISSLASGNYILNFAAPFHRQTIYQAILEHNRWLTDGDLKNFENLVNLARQNIPNYPKVSNLGETICRIFELTVERKLIQPTFICDFPIESSPLARRNDVNPNIADRFELYIAGIEVGNGYSELNDPQDQAARFLVQAHAKEAGDDEAMHYDADYITALEYGMPPTAGGGLGIDRLIMLILNQSNIRDVILFPQMRQI